MDRILAMSLVGAGPCNVFGPGMSAGALESFARDAGAAGRAKAGRNSRSTGAAAGGTRLAASSAGSSGGGKCAAGKRTHEKEADAVGGQEGPAAGGAKATRCCSAVDGRFCGFDFDAVVAPY